MDLTSSELTIAGHQCFVLPKNLCETCIQDSGMSSVARATELSVTKKKWKIDDGLVLIIPVLETCIVV